MNSNGNRGSSGSSTGERTAGFIDLSVLWRRKWSLLLSLVLTLAAGAAYLSQVEPLYESEMRILVQRNVMATAPKPALDDKYFLTTQAEVIWSPVTVRRAVEDAPAALPGESESQTVSRILNSMQVTPLDETNVLKISLRDRNPSRAHRLATAVVDAYAQYVRETEVASREETVRLLAEQEEQLRAELESLRKRFKTNRKETPLVGQGRDALAIQMSRLNEIGEKLAESRKLRMEAENQRKISQRSKNGKGSGGRVAEIVPLSFVPGEPSLHADSLTFASLDESPGLVFVSREDQIAPDGTDLELPSKTPTAPVPEAMLDDLWKIKEQLMLAQAEAARLSEHFGPRHPNLSGVMKQVEWWQQCLRDSRQEAARVAEQEFTALKMTESNLSDLYADELESTKALDAYVMAEQDLADRIQRLEERHQATLTELGAAKLTERALKRGDTPVAVRVLEGQEFAARQVWPKPIQFLGVCAAIGLMGGCVLVSLTEHRRRKSASPASA